MHRVIRNAAKDGALYRVHGDPPELAARLDAIGGPRLRAQDARKTSVTFLQGLQYTRYLPELLASLPEGAVALDCGCADGRGLRWLADAGADRLIGVDLNEASLVRCLEGWGDRAPSPHLVHGNILDCELEPSSLDVVLAIESLYYAGDAYDAALEKLAAALRPGGRLISADPDLEAGLLFSALRGRLADVPELIASSSVHEDIGGLTLVRNVRVQDKARTLTRLGLVEVRTVGISALPLLLMVLSHQGPHASDHALRSRLAAALEPMLRSGHTELNRIHLSSWMKQA